MIPRRRDFVVKILKRFSLSLKIRFLVLSTLLISAGVLFPVFLAKRFWFNMTLNGSEKTLAFSGVFFFYFSLFYILWSIWKILTPGFSELIQGANQIKDGNFKFRIPDPLLKGQNEIAMLCRTFNEMAAFLAEHQEKLMELNKIKTDFVSTVSHELRTPLTVIRGGIGLVLGGAAGPVSLEAKNLLTSASHSSDRLIRLINDLLDVSRIDAGALQLRMEKHPINNLIRYSIAEIIPFAETHKIKIQWAPVLDSPIIAVDQDRFEQILTNLLSNSVKFSPEGSEVQINIIEQENHIAFKVRDDGPGISAENQKSLFKPFSQITKTKNKGTGLGLTICKALVEEHGGQIWIESIEGEGCTFFFSIPWNGIDREKSEEQVLL